MIYRNASISNHHSSISENHESHLQATAHLMQTGALESTHFNEGIHMLHDNLAVFQGFRAIPPKSRGHNFKEYRTTKCRDRRCGSGIISQVDIALLVSFDRGLSFGNVTSSFRSLTLKIWQSSGTWGFGLDLCHQIFLN